MKRGWFIQASAFEEATQIFSHILHHISFHSACFIMFRAKGSCAASNVWIEIIEQNIQQEQFEIHERYLGNSTYLQH